MAYDLISLDPNLDLTRATRPVDGAELVAQRIRIRLHTSVGEVLSDRNAGLWTDRLIAGEPADFPILTSRIVQEIEDTPGVVRVVDFRSSFDRVAQRYTFSAEVLVEDSARTIRVGVSQNTPIQPTGPWAILVEDT